MAVRVDGGIIRMFREPIEKMAPYTPGEQPRPGQRLVKLNTNENPYPPSPRVRRAVIKAASAAMRLYPPPRADEFVASAARLYGFPTRMILAGNGSDELLSMLFRATLGPGDSVAYPLPTYSLYDTLASIQEARVAAVPLGPGFTLPLEQLGRERAHLTIVCNPNSPCGTLAPPRELEKLARALEDAAWMRRNVERVKRTRALTEVRLRKMGFEVPPSSANFVLARFEGHDMGPVAAALRRRGILVRHFPTSVFRDAMRISIGTPAEMAALFKALEPLVKPYVAARGNGRVRNPV